MENRRNFLKKSALLGLAGLTTNLLSEEKLSVLNDIAQKSGEAIKYSLPALPYGFDALEPFIDKQTMEFHHNKHHQAYVDKLNKAIETEKLQWNDSIDNLCKTVSTFDKENKNGIRNNAGGHYNHSLFWKLMKSNPESKPNLPEGKLLEAINKDFKTFDDFKKEFGEKSLKIFGSGWCWLIEQNGKLKITTTPNQDNPLMGSSVVTEVGKPVLALDVWEHAYYLKYQNKRVDYISNWWNVVNWNEANSNYISK